MKNLKEYVSKVILFKLSILYINFCSSVESMGTITIQEINDAQYEDEKKKIYG